MGKKKLHYVKTINGYDYYRYTPGPLSIYYTDYPGYQKTNWKGAIRMELELLYGGYTIYYMVKNDVLLGYGVILAGGRKLRCSTKQDVVIGPCVILKEHRGKGYSNELYHTLAYALDIPCEHAYMYIHDDNLPSIRAAEHSGYQRIGTASVQGLLRKITMDKKGTFIVYQVK